jgi:hypothetical protein
MGITPEFSRAAAEDICFKAQSAGATRRAVDAGGRGRVELGTAALRGPPKDEGEGELQEKTVWRWPFSYDAKREDVDAFSQEALAENDCHYELARQLTSSAIGLHRLQRCDAPIARC